MPCSGKLEYATNKTIPLWKENYAWAFSKDYDPSNEESLAIVLEPNGYPCSIRDKGMQTLKSMHKPWHITFSSYSLTALKAAVQAGLGIGLIAESAISEGMQTLEASKSLPNIPPAEIGLYRSLQANSPAVDTLTDFLLDHLKTPKIKDLNTV